MSVKWELLATNALESFEPEYGIADPALKHRMRENRRKKDKNQELRIKEMIYCKPKKVYKKDEE